MTDMLETIARALFAVRMETAEKVGLHEPYTWETERQGYRDHCLREARAVLEALRIPTEEMETAGADYAFPSPDGAKLVWQRMIDAALHPDSRSSKG